MGIFFFAGFGFSSVKIRVSELRIDCRIETLEKVVTGDDYKEELENGNAEFETVSCE